LAFRRLETATTTQQRTLSVDRVRPDVDPVADVEYTACDRYSRIARASSWPLRAMETERRPQADRSLRKFRLNRDAGQRLVVTRVAINMQRSVDVKKRPRWSPAWPLLWM
jgi:hypothetical protein